MAVRQPDYIIKGGSRTSSSAGSNPVYAEKPIGTLDGVNVTFSLTYTPVNLPAIWLELNGIWQQPPATGITSPNYTITGREITYATAPKSTDSQFIIYFIGPAVGTARGFGSTGLASTDGIDWGNAAAFKIVGDMSWGNWVKPVGGAVYSSLVFQGDDSNASSAFNDLYKLGIVPGSGSTLDVLYAHEYGSASGIQTTFAAALTAGQWVYIGFTRDTTAKTVQLYAGDQAELALVGTFSYSDNPDGGQDPGTRLAVGNQYPGAAFPANAAIKEHYLWGRTLTMGEHLSAAAGKPSTSGLILGCRMGSSPEADISGNGNSGAVTGTTLVQGHS